jgi:hypothetical protein
MNYAVYMNCDLVTSKEVKMKRKLTSEMKKREQISKNITSILILIKTETIL